MTAIPSRLLIGVLVVVSLGLTSRALAQGPEAVYRVSASKADKFQQELDRAAAEGYQLIGGDAGVEVAIWERATDGRRRSYIYAQSVEKFLQDKKLQPGYRLVGPTFGGDADSFSAVFEKVDGDEEARNYGFVRVRSSGALAKRFEQGGDGASGVLAVAWGGAGVGVIYDRNATPSAHRVIGASNTGTITKELRMAGEGGQCVVDGDGVKEALYLLETCTDGGTRAYDVIATTKTETLEKELNAAASKGLRLVRSSLVGIEKRLLFGNAYNYETVAVVEPAAGSPATVYRVIGAVRVATFDRELQAAAVEGFRVIAFALGPKEMVAVMEKKP